MIVTSYTRLFRIVFLHDFYRDPEDILKDISIQPDPATRQLMNGYRLICKIIKNRLDCYVATRVTIRTAGGKTVADILNKPLVDFDESKSMVFNLIINSGRFSDTSNIRSFYPGNSILAFGNDSGNKQNSVLSLTKRLPAYKTSDSYLPGMLVTNASNQTFLALKESGPTNPKNTTNLQYWRPIDQAPYVSQSDLSTITGKPIPFATITVSFRKNLPNDFGLLKKSTSAAQNNLILGKDYVLHFCSAPPP